MDHLGNAKRPALPEPHYWHQCVRLLVAASAVTFAVLLWVLAFQMSGSARSASAGTESDWTGKRCSWGRCKETARLLKSLRSNHTSPCVDFYEHVCAGVHGTSELSVGSANLIVMRQLAAAATASIVRHALVRGPPRLQQTAGEKASAFLKMCKARALRHEDNLSALRSYVQASGLLDEDASFNPLVKTAEYLFVLGLPVFYQAGIDDALVWRRRRLLTVEISTVTELWLKAQRAFSDQVSYTSDPRKFVAMAVYNRKTHALFLSGSSTFAPALDTKGPVEVNYGFFGRIVAQAIVRALASLTDEAPNSSRHSGVWTNDTGRSLRDVALCLGKQADELEESSAQYSQRLHRFRSAASTTARGESSVPGSVVLEALGLAPLYEAYTDAIKYDVPRQLLVLPGLEDLSEERLFFFAWCYSLCSGERMPKSRALASLRCNLAVANQAAFVKAFACDPGLPMNPAVKCPLW
ncbi:hypothetical protein HPB50_023826 [Hyalomma asiaticum]|uniref:Uncharacterized protein n=1 Tax=Hyalomma asiaticum TaxID=266040 RepID=A0ACB7TMI4_HYAAI|nr:hypothetical protein HPB50_023826 [Hyalomma asiaticum]